jgi:hypothetical protein
MVDDQTQPTGARYCGSSEIEAYQALVRQLKGTPIPDQDILANLGLFLTRSSFGRLQFLYKLYLRVLEGHGVVMEFGTWWGQNLALFTTFRSLHEPYNLSRRIIGFDTFAGFPGVSGEDGTAGVMRPGAFGLPGQYEDQLAQLLGAHEALAPRGNVERFELIKGNVEETLPAYLDRHPETVIAMAYFDLDLYRPTRSCLEAIRPFLARNSVLAFDQLCFEEFPGETLALREALGFETLRICRDPLSPIQSYVVFE